MSLIGKTAASSLLSCLIGCASAKVQAPPPVPVAAEEPSCNCWDCWLKVDPPPGWYAHDSIDCSHVLFHRGRMFVDVVGFDYQELGRPRTVIEAFLLKFMREGKEILAVGSFSNETFPASVRYREVSEDGRELRGAVAAKPSNLPGQGILVIGIWPAEVDDQALDDFYIFYWTATGPVNGE